MPTAVTGQHVFRGVADPTRRAILDRLARDGESPALALGKGRSLSQPALSKHLRVLRQAGLVRVRRAGRRQLYSLDARPLVHVERWISLYRAFWSERLAALARHLDQAP